MRTLTTQPNKSVSESTIDLFSFQVGLMQRGKNE